MAPIDSIPLETLAHILALTTEPEKEDSPRAKRGTGRRTLASASLVACRWREPALARMWWYLDIEDDGVARRVAASPASGRYPTSRVRIWTSEMDGQEAVGEMLGHLKGVVHIQVFGPGRRDAEPLDVQWLDLPNLADLTNLEIYSMVVEVSSGLRPRFHLQELSFGGASSWYLSLLEPILSTSSTTISCLTLRDLLPFIHPALLPSLRLVANALVSLELTGSTTGLGSTLSTFTHLEQLIVTVTSLTEVIDLDSLLAALTHPSLRFFLILGSFNGTVEDGVVQAVLERAGKRAWEVLQTVYLNTGAVGGLTDPVGKELVKLCSEKGIAVKTMSQI